MTLKGFIAGLSDFMRHVWYSWMKLFRKVTGMTRRERKAKQKMLDNSYLTSKPKGRGYNKTRTYWLHTKHGNAEVKSEIDYGSYNAYKMLGLKSTDY